MLSFLQPADAPVIETLEGHEAVFASRQTHLYNPLRTLRSNGSWGEVLSRWTLTAEQRAAVAAGADIYLDLCTFGGDLQPIRMAVGQDVDPDYVRIQFGLPPARSNKE